MSVKRVKAHIHILKDEREVLFVELSVNDYLERLKVLAEQADKDGKKKVQEFILHLVEADNVDVRIFSSIYDYYDSLNDVDIPIFEYLLANKVNVAWYDFIEFLSDQRGNIIDYFDIITRAFQSGLDCETLKEIEKNSSELKDFAALADKAISELDTDEKNEPVTLETSTGSNLESEFIAHLKKENEQLNIRLENTLKELNECRDEQKRIMESSIADKHVLLNSKAELERLQKFLNKREAAYAILEKKCHAQKEMITQLSEVNNSVVNVNECMEQEKSELELLCEKLKKDCAAQKSENEMQCVQIETLEKEIAALRNMKQSTLQPKVDDFLQQNMQESVDYPEFGDQDLYNDDFDSSDPTDDWDYNLDDVIEIQDEKDTIKKHSGIFANLVEKLFIKKFERKSVAEQDNLIFIKLMENEYTQDTVKSVKSAMKADQGVSRTILYKMIYNHESDDVVVQFCNNCNLLA